MHLNYSLIFVNITDIFLILQVKKLWYKEVKGSKGGRTTILRGNLTVERGLLTTILCCLFIETRFYRPPLPFWPQLSQVSCSYKT